MAREILRCALNDVLQVLCQFINSAHCEFWLPLHNHTPPHPPLYYPDRMARMEMTMPKMGESIMEGTVLKWLKQVGDAIEQDE